MKLSHWNALPDLFLTSTQLTLLDDSLRMSSVSKACETDYTAGLQTRKCQGSRQGCHPQGTPRSGVVIPCQTLPMATTIFTNTPCLNAGQ